VRQHGPGIPRYSVSPPGPTLAVREQSGDAVWKSQTQTPAEALPYLSLIRTRARDGPASAPGKGPKPRTENAGGEVRSAANPGRGAQLSPLRVSDLRLGGSPNLAVILTSGRLVLAMHRFGFRSQLRALMPAFRSSQALSPACVSRLTEASMPYHARCTGHSQTNIAQRFCRIPFMSITPSMT